MSSYRHTMHRRNEIATAASALAALGVLLATAAVHSQNQTTTTTQAPQTPQTPQTPEVRQPAPARPLQQPLYPRQRIGVNGRQTTPGTVNSNQVRNLMNLLGSHNLNNGPFGQSQLRSPSSPLIRTTPSTSRSTAGISRSTTHLSMATHPFAGHPAPPGSHETRTASGNIVRKAADGSVLAVANPKNGMLIQHGMDGSRRILVNQADRSRILAASRGVQYVQHPYTFRGQTYDHRTYYFEGQTAHHYYRPYTYGGATLDAYTPSRFYPQNLYGWALSSFRPTPFQWPYTNQAWYRHYNGYFTPEASYTSPLPWLADFVIGSSLVIAYNTVRQSRQAPPPVDDSAAITPEVKEMVAQEVGRQVRQEAVEARQNASNVDPQPGASSVVAELTDRQTHAFVVGSDMDLVDSSGRRCMISEGDVVGVVSPAKAESGTADAVVLASKGSGECGRSARVQIGLNDLQEMQNHMRETIDQGLANTKAGKSVSSVTPDYAAAGPPADADAAQEIQRQQEIAAAADS